MKIIINQKKCKNVPSFKNVCLPCSLTIFFPNVTLLPTEPGMPLVTSHTYTPLTSYVLQEEQRLRFSEPLNNLSKVSCSEKCFHATKLVFFGSPSALQRNSRLFVVENVTSGGSLNQPKER